MVLELSLDERSILASLVQQELDELGPEIHHTRTSSFREELVERRHLLQGLLERLRPVTV